MQEGNLSSTIDTILATSDTHTHTATAVHNAQPSLSFHVMFLAILLETDTSMWPHISQLNIILCGVTAINLHYYSQSEIL